MYLTSISFISIAINFAYTFAAYGNAISANVKCCIRIVREKKIFKNINILDLCICAGGNIEAREHYQHSTWNSVCDRHGSSAVCSINCAHNNDFFDKIKTNKNEQFSIIVNEIRMLLLCQREEAKILKKRCLAMSTCLHDIIVKLAFIYYFISILQS